MIQRPAVLFLICLSLAFTLGCAHVRNNLHNTVSDAMDMVRFDVSLSFGTDMGAHVMATQYVQLKSYSYEDLIRLGVGTRSMGVWDEERQDWWIGPLHARNMHARSKAVSLLSHDLAGKAKSGKNYAMGVAAESVDEIGVGLHAFIAGARVGIRPLEILDFLVCPFGLDLCNDNTSLSQRQLEAALRKKAEAKKQEEGEEQE